jgi:predicted MFS family arabinose efflux permease
LVNILGNFIIISILFATAFLLNGTVLIIAPVLKFISQDLNFGFEYFGVVLFIFPLVSFIANLFVGNFSDRYGRRIMIVIGLCGLVAIYLLTALSRNVYQLIFFRGASGIFTALLGSSSISYIADCYKGEQLNRNMGIIIAGGYISQIISIPIGILLGNYITWKIIFYAFSVISLMLAAMAFLYLKNPDVKLEKKETKYFDKLQLLMQQKNIYISITIFSLIYTALMLFYSLFPTWLYDTFKNIEYYFFALLFLTGGLIGFICVSFTGKIYSIVHNKLKLMAVLCVLTLLPLLFITSFTKYFYMCFIFYGLFMAASSLSIPVFRLISLDFVVAKDRGTFTGFVNAFSMLGSTIGAFAGAFLYKINFNLNIIALVIIQVCIIVFLNLLYKANKS